MEISKLKGRKIVFDTSAINYLLDSPEKLEGLLRQQDACIYSVLLTETMMAEVVATRNENRRQSLFLTLERLLKNGACTLPFNLILKGLVKAYETTECFDWRQCPIRCPPLELGIQKHEPFTDYLSEVQRKQSKQLGESFETTISEMRRPFEEFFLHAREGHRPSFSSLLQTKALRTTAELLYNLFSSSTADSQNVQRFYEACPPFRAMVISYCLAIFDRAIREKPIRPAGRLDMFMATYLPYCDIFVSCDLDQIASLKNVAEEAKLGVSVLSLEEFENPNR